MRRPILFLSIGAGFAVVVASLAVLSGPERERYLVAAIDRGDISTTVTAIGSVSPVGRVEVGSQISGQIAELLVDFNDAVKRGQPLARLDPVTFEAQVREAEAEFAQAEAQVLIRQAALDRSEAELANSRAGRSVVDARVESAQALYQEAKRALERRRALRKTGTSSLSDLEKAQAEFKSARAKLNAESAQTSVENAEIRASEAGLVIAEGELQTALAEMDQKKAALDFAQAELTRTVIRAPIAGVVIDRSVELGQTVAASLQAPTLFTIAQDLRRVVVETSVDEADIGRVRGQQQALFTVDAHPGRSFSGTVSQIRVSPRVFENVVTYTVIISADNPDLALFPGMTANVRLIVKDAVDVLRVPNAALRFTPSGYQGPGWSEPEKVRIWTLVDGRPVAVPLKVGASDGQWTEILVGNIDDGVEVIVAAVPAGSGSGLFGWIW